MQNFVYDGRSLPVTASSALKSGDGVLVGSLFGVASVSGSAGAEIQIRTEGVFNLAKVTGGIAAGAPVYWDGGAKKVTGVAAGNRRIGVAVREAASSAASVRVKLGVGPAMAEPAGAGPLIASAELDFPSLAAGASHDLTIAVPGAALGDAVSLALPAAPTAGLVFQGFVSAADTVSVRATNITAASVDAAAQTVGVTVHQA